MGKLTLYANEETKRVANKLKREYFKKGTSLSKKFKEWMIKEKIRILKKRKGVL